MTRAMIVALSLALAAAPNLASATGAGQPIKDLEGPGLFTSLFGGEKAEKPKKTDGKERKETSSTTTK